MPDVQNLLHKALAVIFEKTILQKKAFGELYPMILHSSCAFNVYAEVTLIYFSPYKLPLKNGKVLCLYCTQISA